MLGKKSRILSAAVVVLSAISILKASASVKPNGLFTDGAVLQRGMSVPVWGTANNGEKVTVKFQGQEVSTIARDGRWSVRLDPLRTGGPFTMTIAGENTIELKNVLVGEVWLCSGQSNMGMAIKITENGEKVAANAKDPMLRMYTVTKNTSRVPLYDVADKWEECAPNTAPNLSAVGYYFGEKLRKTLKVPVGLIVSSRSASRVESWTSTSTIIANPEYRKLFSTYTRENEFWRPCALYNAMISPIRGYAIKGVAWYQGESNVDTAFLYRKQFPDMIAEWRRDWGQGDFPFIFVQIAPFGKYAKDVSAELREAQLLASLTVPNTAMAVITDLGDEGDIHPKKKEPVGARLALAAEAVAYGKKVAYQSPVYKSMQIKGDRIVLSFDHAEGGLTTKGGELTGFTIAGADRKFVDAKAEIKGSTIEVWSAEVANPVAVRFGWANYALVNLYNNAGLPSSTFRTDDFPMVTAPK